MANLEQKWDEFLDTVIEDAKDLAGSLWEGWKQEAGEDAKKLAEFSKEKLVKWSQALAEDKIDKDEYALLVRSLTTLAKLDALKAKGLADQRLEQLRIGLISIITRATHLAIGI